MWVMTQYGFYSTVAHRKEPDKVLVRTRWKDDLKILEERYGTETFNDPHADYPWRMLLTKDQWGEFLDWAAHDLDYANFKNRVSAKQGAARHDLYSSIWSKIASAAHASGGGGKYIGTTTWSGVDMHYPTRDEVEKAKGLFYVCKKCVASDRYLDVAGTYNNRSITCLKCNAVMKAAEDADIVPPPNFKGDPFPWTGVHEQPVGFDETPPADSAWPWAPGNGKIQQPKLPGIKVKSTPTCTECGRALKRDLSRPEVHKATGPHSVWRCQNTECSLYQTETLVPEVKSSMAAKMKADRKGKNRPFVCPQCQSPLVLETPVGIVVDEESGEFSYEDKASQVAIAQGADRILCSEGHVLAQGVDDVATWLDELRNKEVAVDAEAE